VVSERYCLLGLRSLESTIHSSFQVREKAVVEGEKAVAAAAGDALVREMEGAAGTWREKLEARTLTIALTLALTLCLLRVVIHSS
jgi:hypothetical protein